MVLFWISDPIQIEQCILASNKEWHRSIIENGNHVIFCHTHKERKNRRKEKRNESSENIHLIHLGKKQ